MSSRRHRQTPARVALLSLGLSIPVYAQQSPAWHIVEQTTRNETTRLLTTLSSDTYTSADGLPRHATLQLKCIGNATASLSVDSDSTDIFTVKSESALTLPVRLDEQPVIPIGWSNPALRRILLYDLRDLLPSHRRLSVDLPLNNAAPQAISFNLSALAAAMHENGCRRRL